MSTQPNKNPESFREYINQGIRLVSAFRDEPILKIQEEMGDYCGRSSKTIELYRAGTIPPDNILLKMGEYLVREAKVEQAWIEGMLQIAGYAEWETASAKWFPVTMLPPHVQQPENTITQATLTTLSNVPSALDGDVASLPLSVSPTSSQHPPEKPRYSRHNYPRLIFFTFCSLLLITGFIAWRHWQVARLQDGRFAVDGGFEKTTDLSHWRNVGGCKMTVKEGSATEGTHYLEVVGAAPCYSFSQDINLIPVLRRTYTLSVWLRSPEPAYPRGELVIWAGRRIQNEFNDLEKGVTVFQVKGDQWQCVSTQITVDNPDSSMLRAEIYLKGYDGQLYQVDDFQFTEGTESPCPFTSPQLYNASFEEISDSIAPWFTESQCTGTVREDSDLAYHGLSFLSVVPRDINCHSFRQSVDVNAHINDTYTYSVWLRSSDNISRTIEIVMWGRGNIEEKSYRFYTIEGTEWQCTEATLQTQQSGPLELVLEVYLHHNPVGSEIWADNASFQIGVSESCPQDSLQIVDLVLPFGTNATYYAGGTIPVVAEIANQGVTNSAPVGAQYYIAQHMNADGVDLRPSMVMYIEPTIPALAPDSIYQQREENIYIPLGLPPGQYYAIAQLGTMGDRFTLATPITIVACEGSLYYCDMSEDHWAYPATQQWAELRISSGCRSNTEPYVNRPFCPKQIVDNWATAVFLLRHLKGADFQASVLSEGHFVDIPENNMGRFAFEYFHQQGIDLIPMSCSSTPSEPKACPLQLVTRGDLARYLAMILQWELETVARDYQTELSDLPEDEFTRNAILYMEANDFLDYSEPDCLPVNGQLRFCPELPLRRANAAVMMTRAFAGSAIPLYP